MIDSNNRNLARNSIPCLFNLTVINLRSSFVTISNMDVSQSYEKDGLQFTHFKITPFIRVESMVIIISRFNCKDTLFYDTNTPFKVSQLIYLFVLFFLINILIIARRCVSVQLLILMTKIKFNEL